MLFKRFSVPTKLVTLVSAGWRRRAVATSSHLRWPESVGSCYMQIRIGQARVGEACDCISHKFPGGPKPGTSLGVAGHGGRNSFSKLL